MLECRYLNGCTSGTILGSKERVVFFRSFLTKKGLAVMQGLFSLSRSISGLQTLQASNREMIQ